MGVEEIKQTLVSLSSVEQREVSAFLFQLRQGSDTDYQERVGQRLSDRKSENWLTPEDFERELDSK